MNFDQAEQRYAQLRQRANRGDLTDKQFADELAKLRLKTADGVWWTLRPQDGRWLRWDGAKWVVATPPRAGTAPTPAAAPQRRRGRGCLWTILIILGVLVVLAGGGYWAIQSGRLSAMQLQSRISGEASILIYNLADGPLEARLVQLDSAEGENSLGGETLNQFESGGYGALEPNRYQLTFNTSGAPPPQTCTMQLARGDAYVFVAVPEGITIVNERANQTTADDLDVAVSSLCRQ